MKKIPCSIAAALVLTGCAVRPQPHRRPLPPPPPPRPDLVSIPRRDFDAMSDAVHEQTDADITFVSRKPDGSVDVWTVRKFWYRTAAKVKYTVRKTRGGWQVVSRKAWF